MARRLDRRVQRTRKLLREALMALILDEGYDTISIQDITDKANLGRATFYLHFKDKDELLLDVMSQLMSEFVEIVPQFSQNQWRLEDTKALAKLFDFAADHYDLYRILIIGSGGIKASRQIHQIIAKNIELCIQKEIEDLGAEPSLPAHFIANYFAGSLLATVFWWLDQDLPYSAEEMAELFQKINMLDRDALMGLGQLDEEKKEEVDKRTRKKPPKKKPDPKNDKQDAQEAGVEGGEPEVSSEESNN